MSRITRVFLSGLLAILPLIVTVIVTAWVVSIATEYIGPSSKVGQLLTSLGLGVGAGDATPYIIGLALILGLIYLLGLIVETRLGPWLFSVLEASIRRVPVVSNVYDMSKRFVSIVDTKGGDSLKSMSPVWCFFGGEPGAAVLALLPSPKTISIGTAEYLGILIPTAPVPIGGCLIYVPAAWIKPAEGGVEHLMSVYVSMGVTPPITGGSAITKPAPTTVT